MAQWEAVQGCISYRAKESRSVQVCSLYFCVVPDLRQRPGLQQTVAALGALLRCQPRARFALAFKVKLASACAGLQFAYVGKLQTASAPLASPTLLPPSVAVGNRCLCGMLLPPQPTPLVWS